MYIFIYKTSPRLESVVVQLNRDVEPSLSLNEQPTIARDPTQGEPGIIH